MAKAAIAAGGIAAAASVAAIGISQQAPRPFTVAASSWTDISVGDQGASFTVPPTQAGYQPTPPELGPAPPTDVPEPASVLMVLFGTGAALLARRGRIQR